MQAYLIKRFFYLIFLLWLTTVVVFIVIQLPPGDYLSTVIAQIEQQTGDSVNQEIVENLRRQYGLDLPPWRRYFKWLGALLQGDLGYSFDWKQPVNELIGERLALTLTITIVSAIVTYAIAIPIGIYSATHQYSIGDYIFTTLGFIGLAVPNFMLALILLFIGFKYFNVNLTGLFSPEFVDAPWSFAKVVDLFKHLPIPVIVLGTGGAAGLIRILRASLLDELGKQYVVTARSKGMQENRLLFKYPVRVALNPLISNLAWLFPLLISGDTIVAIVLGLPTLGPLLFRSLITQDTFLTASILFFLTILTILGTTISDILLVLVDPRIRMERSAS
ncbi:MAG: ABC transporter permease [Chloroflexota bacterium]